MYHCSCGFAIDPITECTCSNQVITRYQLGSLLLPHLKPDERTQSTAHHMHFIELLRVEYEKLSDSRLEEK